MATPEDSGDKIEVLPSTETDAGTSIKEEVSSVTEEQWTAMKGVLDFLLNYRDGEGNDPSKMFHKRVNKRNVPTYYDVIKEPMAFSNLKAAIANREYKTFSEFVRGCGLIWHNAHTYNRPDAGAYQDASVMKDLMEKEFQKLVDRNIVSREVASWPELGEIPPVEDIPPDEDDDEEEEEEDDDEDGDETDEDGTRKRRPGRRPSGLAKRESAVRINGQTGETKKKRGRPPKVDTPMEARIKNVLKGLRKYKDDQGNLRILHFEKLPDKAAMPEYFSEIKHPISIEQIKRSQKRKRYKSVDHFMRDIDIMFDNAKRFNEDESEIYKDADYLQKEAHQIAELEKRRADSDFLMDDGRRPRPQGIVHRGEFWKVGDWVHIKNANDVTKPIIAQIYRTWEDGDGQEWVNACWYYRPEQTVHHYEKHFYPMEVVKTGQYRDHPIEDVIDRCFVMFFTRYGRGRPRGTPPEREVYVCEARYNEEKLKINKIKTWASCLPDEVRDNDYEMDLFDVVRKVKKVPSPLLHLLSADSKEGEIPKPRWGNNNAPPIVGGIYKGPRDENQSPPPEPTPSPPPPTAPPAPRQVPQTPTQSSTMLGQPSEALAEDMPRTVASTPATLHVTHQQIQPSQPRRFHDLASSASPAPAQYYQTQTPQQSYSLHGARSAQQLGTSTTYDQYTMSQSRFAAHQTPNRYSQLQMPRQNGMIDTEVFTLPPAANAAIPEAIREQYQQDEDGQVLFFSKPPLDVPSFRPGEIPIRHSVKFRAEQIRKARALREQKESSPKHTEGNLPISDNTEDVVEIDPVSTATGSQESKRVKTSQPQARDSSLEQELPFVGKFSENPKLDAWVSDLDSGTENLWKQLYGDRWKEGRDSARAILAQRQRQDNFAPPWEVAQEMKLKNKEKEKKEKWNEMRALMKGPNVYLDDIHPW